MLNPRTIPRTPRPGPAWMHRPAALTGRGIKSPTKGPGPLSPSRRPCSAIGHAGAPERRAARAARRSLEGPARPWGPGSVLRARLSPVGPAQCWEPGLVLRARLSAEGPVEPWGPGGALRALRSPAVPAQPFRPGGRGSLLRSTLTITRQRVTERREELSEGCRGRDAFAAFGQVWMERLPAPGCGCGCWQSFSWHA